MKREDWKDQHCNHQKIWNIAEMAFFQEHRIYCEQLLSGFLHLLGQLKCPIVVPLLFEVGGKHTKETILNSVFHTNNAASVLRG